MLHSLRSLIHFLTFRVPPECISHTPAAEHYRRLDRRACQAWGRLVFKIAVVADIVLWLAASASGQNAQRDDAGKLALILPADWATRTVAKKARWMVAVHEASITAFNSMARTDLAQARRVILPKVLLVSARLAELRMQLPAAPKTDPLAIRLDRKSIVGKLTQAERAASEPDRVFSGAVVEEPVLDPAEDFTTYTETDPNGRLAETASTVTATKLTDAEIAYVYRDCGAAHFANFTHTWDFKITYNSAGYVAASAWGVANTLKDARYWQDNNSQAVCGIPQAANSGGSAWLSIRDNEDGTGDTDFTAIAFNTTYYCTTVRNGTSLVNSLYSDSARTSLVDTEAVTLASGRTYRYVFAANSFNSGGTNAMSYTISNLDLGEAAAAGGIVPLYQFLRQRNSR